MSIRGKMLVDCFVVGLRSTLAAPSSTWISQKAKLAIYVAASHTTKE